MTSVRFSTILSDGGLNQAASTMGMNLYTCGPDQWTIKNGSADGSSTDPAALSPYGVVRYGGDVSRRRDEVGHSPSMVAGRHWKSPGKNGRHRFDGLTAIARSQEEIEVLQKKTLSLPSERPK